MQVISFVKKNALISWAKKDVVRFTHDGMNFWSLQLFRSIMLDKNYYQVGTMSGSFRSLLDFDLNSGVSEDNVPIWFHVTKGEHQPFVCFIKNKDLSNNVTNVLLSSNKIRLQEKVQLLPYVKIRLNHLKEHENTNVLFYERKYNIWSGSWNYGIIDDEIRVSNDNGKEKRLFYCKLGNNIKVDAIHGISLFIKNRHPYILIYHKSTLSFFSPDCFSSESEVMVTIRSKEPEQYQITLTPKGKFKFVRFNPIIGFGCIAFDEEISFFPTIDPEKHTISDCTNPVAVGFSQDGYGIWSEKDMVYQLKIRNKSLK